MQAGTGDIEIRQVIGSDVQKLTVIGMLQLGVDYISDDDFTEAMEDPDQFCLVATINGEPSGFAICREFGPEGERDELALPESPERDWVLSSRRIGLIDSVAISPDAGGRGIGRMLCNECLETFRRDGCDSAVSMAWVHFDGVEPIRKALSSAGFERTPLQIRGYWNQWVPSEGGHRCPYCGAPCDCFGAMWRKRL